MVKLEWSIQQACAIAMPLTLLDQPFVNMEIWHDSKNPVQSRADMASGLKLGWQDWKV